MAAQPSPTVRRRRLGRRLKRLREGAGMTLDEAALAIHAIIDEAALRKKVGGPEVMRAQLRHLMERSTLDTVTIQVLPDDAGAHSGIDGAFIVLQFAEEEDPDLLYVTYPTGSIHVEKAEEVRQARIVFDTLRSEALSPRDSIAFIERMA